jgi:hypothetical protein
LNHFEPKEQYTFQKIQNIKEYGTELLEAGLDHYLSALRALVIFGRFCTL